MANLYLVDKFFGKNAQELVKADKGAKVVLIQDGVYLEAAAFGGADVYAVKQDVEKRGLSAKVTKSVKVIDYGQLVDLIVGNKVINFT